MRKLVLLSLFSSSARIEDEDSDCECDEWMVQEEGGEGAVFYPLDPVRFWRAPDALNENLDVSGGRCLGIQCNILNRAMYRRHLRHTMRGGGRHHIGYTALKWQAILRGDCGRLG